MKNVDFNNPANYKNCSKKLYEIHVCMPPKDTVVINSLEQADVVKMLNGKTYFTLDELEHMQKNGDGRFNIISQAVNSGRAYLVSDKTPFVLCGTSGELWTISPDKLAQTYTFLQNNQPYSINQQSLSQRVRKDGLLDWTTVRVSQQAIQGQNMACFVPSSQKGQIQTSWGAVLNINGVGVSHGKGDFVVCAKLPNGKPNLADRWVVNGEIFAATYNNQGWTDCLSSSSVRSITIDSLPKLVPQQVVNNDKGVDANVFKQKCDTLMKELQKIYKFNVKSNTYEQVKDYTGIAKEVKFNDDCYVAKYIVEGNFSHTYSVKDKATGNMTEKTVTATETDVWFGCSAVHCNSAISMAMRPKTDGLYLMGWAFPDNSNTKATDDYWSCKVGTIKDINCAEEVKLFSEKCKGRDVFIDNRKNSSEDYLNVIELVEAMSHSNVHGSIGISHILEQVYNKLTDDTLKDRVSHCFKVYARTNIGYGSASLRHASFAEAHSKGSMIGQGVLSHKMNLKTLIKYLVSACQKGETKYDALTFLYNLSENALSEAIMKLFYDTNNPNLSVLWKRLDLQYMFNNEIVLHTYNQSEYDINSKRVCLDLRIKGFDGIFIRCIYTASGNYGFDFIPKKPIQGYGVGATFSFDKDYENYLGICKQLRDSCYMCLTDWTNSSRTFIENLPEYLIKTDIEYLGLLGGKVGYFFRILSGNSDANNSDYNRETNTYKIKFVVGNETRVLYMREDEAHTVSVKCTLNGVTFEKSYKLSIKHNTSINAMLIFSDICKALKIHPVKELLKSKRLWDNVTKDVSEKFSTGAHHKFDSDVSSRIDKITPVSIKLNDTNYEILMRFYNNEKVIGERILVVDFNYDNFDIRNSRSRSIKALGDLKHEYDITDMMFTMHYKYGSINGNGTKHDTSFDEKDIESALYWTTFELINSTKKYQS